MRPSSAWLAVGAGACPIAWPAAGDASTRLMKLVEINSPRLLRQLQFTSPLPIAPDAPAITARALPTIDFVFFAGRQVGIIASYI